MSTRNVFEHLIGAIENKCPRCFEGAVYDTFLGMNPECKKCGLRFARESGYFVGALFINYLLLAMVTVPILSLFLFEERVSGWIIILGAAFATAITSPFSLRLSRLIWLHLDHLQDPKQP